MEKNKGFTIFELLVVTSIMLIMSTIVMIRYRSGEKQYSLQIAAQELMSDIRKVQNMALSGQEYQGVIPTGGFGIYFITSSPDSYILFADLDGDYGYDNGEEMQSIKLDSKVEIDSLFPSSPLNIVFTPPEPSISITGGGNGAISLKLKQGTSLKTISITPQGVIEIN